MIVIVPKSIVLRLSGQTIEASFVASPGHEVLPGNRKNLLPFTPLCLMKAHVSTVIGDPKR